MTDKQTPEHPNDIVRRMAKIASQLNCVDKRILKTKDLIVTICNEECGIKPYKCSDSDCRYRQILDIIEGKCNDR